MFIAALALASLLTVASAVDRTTVAEQSAISDPAKQCEIYNFPPIANEIPKFPAVFTKARILPNDAAARAKFDQIKSKVPNIAPKTEEDKDSYDRAKDPDCWWTITQCTKAKAKDVPSDISLVPEPQTLGYGFDDGPNCSHNAFYDHLTEQKQKATMFFIGSNVLAWPLQAKRAMDDGHEICVHSWSHPPMTSLSDEDAFAEIYYTMQAIKLLTGATPTCFRPPFGDIDDRIRAISAGLGLTNILWEHDTFDTNPDMGPEDIQKNYDNFVKLASGGTFSRQGAILLAHETNNMTMQLAIDNYSKLKGAFKHIVPVGIALNKTQPYAEPDFKFPDFETFIKTEAPAQNTTSSSSAVSVSATASRGSSSASSASTPVSSGAVASSLGSSKPSSSVASASSSAATSVQSGSAAPGAPPAGDAAVSTLAVTTVSGILSPATQAATQPTTALANNAGMVTSVVKPTETSTVTVQPANGPAAQGGITAENQNGAMSLLSSPSMVILPAFLLFLGLNL